LGQLLKSTLVPISLHFTLDDQVTLGLIPKPVCRSSASQGQGWGGIHTESEFGKTNLLYCSATLNSKEQSVFSTKADDLITPQLNLRFHGYALFLGGGERLNILLGNQNISLHCLTCKIFMRE